MNSTYIVAAARTPIGRFLGTLAGLSAPELGSHAVRDVVRRSGLPPDRIDEVILGNVLSAGVGQAPARQAMLQAGLPPSIAAVTVNKVCGSGLKAVMLADQAIRAGDAQVIVAGGMESMSRAPHLAHGVRTGWKYGHQQLLDSLVHDGLWCATEQTAMGRLADLTAAEHHISRPDQDGFAAESHRRAVQATTDGLFREEMVPVSCASKQGPAVVDRDDGPRPETTAVSLAKLPSAFGQDGSATAGNASQISDGAAAVMVVSEQAARECTTEIRARIVAAATSGGPPRELFVAPVSAIQRVLAKARMSIEQIDLVELNEAFASQCLACMRPLKLDPDKVNVRGGAIALGHPIGASGARVLVTLLHALKQRGQTWGLVSLCLGGGNAVAMVVERLDR